MARLVEHGLELALGLLVLVSASVALALALAPVAGFQLYAVRSGSMSPTLAVGDLAIGERVPAAAIAVGDVVAVDYARGPTVAHRVVAVSSREDGPRFTTRGDANPGDDATAAEASTVRSRISWRLPGFGYVVALISTPSGIVTVMCLAMVLLTAAWLARDLRASRRERDIEREVAELSRLVRATPPAANLR